MERALDPDLPKLLRLALRHGCDVTLAALDMRDYGPVHISHVHGPIVEFIGSQCGYCTLNMRAITAVHLTYLPTTHRDTREVRDVNE